MGKEKRDYWNPENIQDQVLSTAGSFSRKYTIGREFGFDPQQLLLFNFQFARYIALKMGGKAHPALLGKFLHPSARELERIVDGLDTAASGIQEMIEAVSTGEAIINLEVSASARARVSSLVNLDSSSPMGIDAIQRAANILSAVFVEDLRKPELDEKIREAIQAIKSRELPQQPSL